jgi:[protein-PII] uridylyltransferase
MEATIPGWNIERQKNSYTDACAHCQTNDELAAFLLSERTRLITHIRDNRLTDSEVYAGWITHELSDLMDAVLSRIYALACYRMETTPVRVSLAIVATGGYGRRELCPFSDIDITFLPARENDSLTDRVIREMFRMLVEICMDRCRLEVGYAYRLMSDFGTLDHQTVCGLLDARLIAGSERLFLQLEHEFWSAFNPAEFVFAKQAERDKVAAKWGRTPRSVEPHLKEGVGGLRDLQCAVWMVQARDMIAAARVRGDRAFNVLVREEYLSAEEAAQLARAKNFLLHTRNALHALVGEERDQLVVTRQEGVAEILGYTSTPHDAADAPPVERFMADLYPHLSVVHRLSQRVMNQVAYSRLILGIGLDCKRKLIVRANDALASDDPVWMLWASELAQKYSLAWHPKLESAAVALVALKPPLSPSPDAPQIFTRLISQVGSIYPTLQQMANLGILGWFLPEFGQTMDLIPYDPSHDHTVGQHTLFVIRELEQVGLCDENEDAKEMRRLLLELPHPEQLILAALLHDSGKAIPDKPHSETGVDIVHAVCRRLGWEPDATENVAFLVRHHLLMSETSRLLDITRDETVQSFTQIVDDPDRLNMLYLLTYADTRAVGAGVWTPVKGKFLRDLWRRSAAVLHDEEGFGMDADMIARARRRLQKDLTLKNLPEAEVTEHIEAMPPLSLLNQSLAQMALQMEFVRRVRGGEIVVDFHDERDGSYTELTVCAPDDPQPGLLAKIAGALYAADLNVHAAQVLTRISTDRIALDTLYVDFRGRLLTPGKRKETTMNLLAVLGNQISVTELIQKQRHAKLGASRNSPKNEFSPTAGVTSIRNDLADDLSVIEMQSSDVQGILYRGAAALCEIGWDIASARISSFRKEARATFYVAGARHLTERDAKQQLEHALAAPHCAV